MEQERGKRNTFQAEAVLVRWNEEKQIIEAYEPINDEWRVHEDTSVPEIAKAELREKGTGILMRRPLRSEPKT